MATRGGWFSDRSACYLASGKPVLAQDTGFGDTLPTGDGLLAFSTLDEAVAGGRGDRRNLGHHSRSRPGDRRGVLRRESGPSDLLEDLGAR